MGNHNQHIRDLLVKLTSGSLSGEEKALLDRLSAEDPFLKDAMDGYLGQERDQTGHIEDLKKRLTRKKDGRFSLFIPVRWKIAATVLLLVSGLSVIYYLGSPLFFGGETEMTALQMDEQEAPVTAPRQPEVMTEDIASADEETSRVASQKQAPSPSEANPESERRMDRPAALAEPPAGTSSPSSAVMAAQHQGQINDGADLPLIGAEIRLQLSDTSIFTGPDGRFTLPPMDGKESVIISYAGYFPRKFEGDVVSQLDTIVLQEDPERMTRLMASYQSPPSASPLMDRSRKSQYSREAVVDEPVPLGGWARYYAYIEQNRNTPRSDTEADEEIRASFTIDRSGRPVQIEIEKSPGPVYAEEALRLIAEGPDWAPPSDPDNRFHISIHF